MAKLANSPSGPVTSNEDSDASGNKVIALLQGKKNLLRRFRYRPFRFRILRRSLRPLLDRRRFDKLDRYDLGKSC